jgi:hypothetical protein
MPRIRGVAQLNSPAIAASVPTPAPWVTSSTQTGTSTSGSNVVTGLTSTANLNIGQPVNGTGSPPGNTILTIDSATQIHTTLNFTASGSPSLTFPLWDPWNTGQFAGGFGGYSLPMPGGDVIGCLIEIPNLITLAAAATYILPPGEGQILCVAGTTTGPTYQVFQGTSSPAWVTLFTFTASATTLLQYFMSDGANFRVNNLAATASTFTIYQWR